MIHHDKNWKPGFIDTIAVSIGVATILTLTPTIGALAMGGAIGVLMMAGFVIGRVVSGKLNAGKGLQDDVGGAQKQDSLRLIPETDPPASAVVLQAAGHEKSATRVLPQVGKTDADKPDAPDPDAPNRPV